MRGTTTPSLCVHRMQRAPGWCSAPQVCLMGDASAAPGASWPCRAPPVCQSGLLRGQLQGVLMWSRVVGASTPCPLLSPLRPAPAAATASPSVYGNRTARTAWLAEQLGYAQRHFLDGINFDLVRAGGWGAGGGSRRGSSERTSSSGCSPMSTLLADAACVHPAAMAAPLLPSSAAVAFSAAAPSHPRARSASCPPARRSGAAAWPPPTRLQRWCDEG